jgi:hypothetical protein
MNNEDSTISNAKEYRGCDIRVASHEVSPQTWIPQACVSLSTELGSKKLWVQSFAHCFSQENVTFNNRSEADHWARSAAMVIIDRALPEISAAALPSVQLVTKHIPRVVRSTPLPVRALDRLRHFMHPLINF